MIDFSSHLVHKSRRPHSQTNLLIPPCDSPRIPTSLTGLTGRAQCCPEVCFFVRPMARALQTGQRLQKANTLPCLVHTRSPAVGKYVSAPAPGIAVTRPGRLPKNWPFSVKNRGKAG